MNRIGYACINTSLKPRGFKECRLKSIYKYGIGYLKDKILNNLEVTQDILLWNIENGISMYRGPSNILPLVTHPDILRDFTWRWQADKEIETKLNDIRKIISENDIRFSMHPDQFTVLNSLNKSVVENSIINLQYHCDFIKRVGGTDIIIHTGGVYGDKKTSMDRFISNFIGLDREIKELIRLENDDISYNINDVLFISEKTGVPIVLDIHHHWCNHESELTPEIINKIMSTWSATGMTPKMHLSSGKTSVVDRKHSDYISMKDYIKLAELVKDWDVDLMVEAKMKDVAVLRLMAEIQSWS